MWIRARACSVHLVWSNLCLLYWQADSLPLSHQGSPALILISKLFPLNIICLDYWVDDPLKFWAQDKCCTHFILVTSWASPSKCHLMKIIIFCGVCPRLFAGLNFGYDSGSLTSLFFPWAFSKSGSSFFIAIPWDPNYLSKNSYFNQQSEILPIVWN